MAFRKGRPSHGTQTEALNVVQRERQKHFSWSPIHALLTFQMGISLMHYLIAEIERVQDMFFILFLDKTQTEYHEGFTKPCLGISCDSFEVLFSN